MFTRLTHSTVLALSIGLLLPAVGHATTIHVPGDRPNIKSAINSAHDGDVVLVADGVYTGGGNRNLDFHGKAITVRSEHGPENCTIDCQGLGRAFHFHHGETDQSVLDGFTIRNGSAENGGAILCDGSSPTILNCVFIQNTATGTDFGGGGGAVYCEAGNPTLSHCSFNDNVATGTTDQGGGGLCVFGGSAALSDCTFSGNHAEWGGGLGVAPGSTATLTHCTFSANSADSAAGGLVVVAAVATIVDCAFVGNLTAGNAGGVAVTDFGLSSEVHFSGCTFHGNSSGDAGGALYVFAQSPDATVVTLDDGVMSGNSGTGDGGAIANNGATLMLNHCTLAGNSLFEGMGPMPNWSAGAGVCAWNGGVTMSSNCIWQANTSNYGPQFSVFGDYDGDGQGANTMLMVEFSTVQGGENDVYVDAQTGADVVLSWGIGNTSADAVFVRNPSPGADGMWGTPDDDLGDLHLLPGSPCIDAGDPSYVPAPGETDVDGDPRVLDGDGNGSAVIDIGADEFVLPPCLGDVNGDASIDLSDFNVLMAHWGAAAGATYADGDVDGDTDVDLRDFAFIARAFGQTCP